MIDLFVSATGLNFMDELLEMITSAETIHNSFRVWITTDVHPHFPISLLQVGRSSDAASRGNQRPCEEISSERNITS